jgi:hypothetical protein
VLLFLGHAFVLVGFLGTLFDVLLFVHDAHAANFLLGDKIAHS